MEMAADPQPSSVCLTYGTSSQIPAFSWGPVRAEGPRKRSRNRPRTIRFIRIRSHSSCKKLAECDRQDDDADGDQDNPKQIAIGNASGGEITLRLTRTLGQFGKVFIAQLADGLVHFLIVKVGGLQRSLRGRPRRVNPTKKQFERFFLPTRRKKR